MKQTIKNIMAWIKGAPSKCGIDRLIVYPLLFIFAITTFSKCGKGTDRADLTFEDCSQIAQVYADSMVSDAVKTTIVSHLSEDNPVPHDTIIKEVVRWKEHTTFVQTWNDLQEARARNASIIEEKQKISDILNTTRMQFDSIVAVNGLFTFDDFDTVVEAPLVRTNKDEETEDYKIEEEILSRGGLERFTRTITVKPKTQTVIQKEIEYLQKKNFLALKAGALYIDGLNNLYYAGSLEWGHNFWLVEAGALLDQDFSFRGLEAKAGVVVKFK